MRLRVNKNALLCVLECTAFSLLLSLSGSSIGAVTRVDQSQTLVDYGFWFDDQVPRWQEFVPSIPNLAEVSVWITKWGQPGNLTIEVTDRSFGVLRTVTLNESDVATGWVLVSFAESLELNLNEIYRIRVFAERDSVDPTNRYFWRGSNTDNYQLGAKNSVYSSWPAFDFAFITRGTPNPVNVSGLSAPIVKAAIDRGSE